MSTIEISLIDLATAAKSIPEDTPVMMLNLIKFKPQTTYPEGSEWTTVSGEEAYVTRYVPTLIKFAAAEKEAGSGFEFKPLFVGKPQINLVAEPHAGSDKWDRVGILRYPSFAMFRKWVESKEYKETAMPHRLASLESYRLYACIE